MTVYDVTVSRDDNLWVADIDGGGLGPAAMDYESLDELRDDVPALIADLADVEVSDVEVEYAFIANGQDVTPELEHLISADAKLRRAKIERDDARSKAIKALSKAGVSQRSMADLFGLSHQRVNQLLAKAAADAGKPRWKVRSRRASKPEKADT